MTLSKFTDKVFITAYSGTIILKVVAAAPPGTLGYAAAATAAAAPTILYVSTATILVDVLDTKVGIPKSITCPIAIVGVTAAVAPEILVISAGCGVVGGVSHISHIISEKLPSKEKVEEITDIVQQKSLLAYEFLPSREDLKKTFESSKSIFWTVYESIPSQKEVRDTFESTKSTFATVYESIPYMEEVRDTFQSQEKLREGILLRYQNLRSNFGYFD
mgnify:CR=1 FL=1|tara:strand:+ start:119 stop:772 length:654 start_codon:yes stop_codon:yes gene_type:complete